MNQTPGRGHVQLTNLSLLIDILDQLKPPKSDTLRKGTAFVRLPKPRVLQLSREYQCL